MKNRKKYDVVICGGGLAGLTLALQVKLSKPDVSILVLEKRSDTAPIAIHKVGESKSELGSHYLREVLHLKDYLIEHQLPKFGFRFFFSQENREHIDRRVEVGSKISNPIPTHQIDRGRLENELVNRLIQNEVEVVLGATVKNLEISKTGHTIDFEKEEKDYTLEGRWLIDATGRRSLLKRKLGLELASDHDVNAVWFRLGCKIDIDDWSDNEGWRNYLIPGRRRLATNHLMGEGYWVWIIPLVADNTSIGIVADPAYHPFDQFNTYEKAMTWLEKYEPVAARMLGKHKTEVLDFKVMKHFAHDTKQFFSVERWGLTGDAGAFMDPFYSPGSDFIALNNTWLTDLIIHDLAGEDISLRAMIYERAERELFNGWMLLYKNMYGLFGKTQIMLMKIVWDWGSYWAIPSLMFMNKGYTNITLLKEYSSTSGSIGRRFARLNERMQALFLAWGQYDIAPCAFQQINVFDLDCLDQFHQGLYKKYEARDLIRKVEANLVILEQIAAGIFRLASMQIHQTPPDMRVDPYTMDIHDTGDELIAKSKELNAIGVGESIATDLASVWLTPLKSMKNEYAR
jgi:flavin-dependent dehydrogenase